MKTPFFKTLARNTVFLSLFSFLFCSQIRAEYPYAGSDAQVFFESRLQRLREGTWVNYVQYKDEKVDISNCPPSHLMRTFLVSDATLAQEAEVAPGTILSLEEFQNNGASMALTEGLYDKRVIELSKTPNPYYFETTPLPVEVQQRIDGLRDQLHSRIRELNQITPTGFYQNPKAGRYVMVNEDGKSSGVPNASLSYDAQAFSNVLLAIQNGAEEDFLDRAISFATLFDVHNAGKRSGFIDVFTHMFVTRAFPTRGMREYYSHMTLRCGILTGDR
jgi:hypothetical protein